MLDHEKSFLLQDGAANIDSLSLYQDSILITSLNDVVQKDIETGAIQRTFRAHSNGISSLLITNDSRMITAGLDDKVIIWDLVTGSVLKRINLGSVNFLLIDMALQDNQLRVGGRDATLRRIDLISGRIITSRSD
jgi:WD40 repeat protein